MILIISTLIFFATSAKAEVGVTDTDVQFTSINGHTAPGAHSGMCLNLGTQLYFDRTNANGGVHGRQLKLQILEDDRDPAKTAELTEKVISENKTFAFIHFISTPSVKAAYPKVERAGIPFLFPRTGDPFVRTPFKPLIFNILDPNEEQAERLYDYLVKKRGKKTFAIIGSDDAQGSTVRNAFHKVLAKNKSKFSAIGTFSKDPASLSKAFQEVEKADPDVVVFGTNVPQALQIIKLAQSKKKKWTYAGIGALNSIAKNLTGDEVEIFLVQTAPNLLKSPTPLGVEFREAAKTSKKVDECVDVYRMSSGYLSAKIAVDALTRAGKDLSRISFLSAFEKSPFDLKGFSISFSKESHSSSLGVLSISTIKGGRLVDL